MTRIDDRNPVYRDVIRRTYKKHPLCSECKEPATIWIRLGSVEEPKNDPTPADLFLCDVDALHLSRILLQDIGHVRKILKNVTGEPTG